MNVKNIRIIKIATDDGRNIPKEVPQPFWNVIERSNGDPAVLRGELEAMTVEDIVKFYWNYEEAVAQIKPLYHEFSHFSEDSVDEICYWLVAQGASAYKEFWNAPDEAITREESPYSKLRDDPGLVSEIYEVYEERFHESLPDKEHAYFVE